MKSTGEVLGIARNFEDALLKVWWAPATAAVIPPRQVRHPHREGRRQERTGRHRLELQGYGLQAVMPLPARPVIWAAT